MNEKPSYIHDCDKCRYLGEYRNEGIQFDLYYCHSDLRPTLIARYGDEGCEYMSGLETAAHNEVMGEAAVRAIKLLAAESNFCK